MDEYLIALGSAAWLGILTSISPCPMATNIAAITYIGRGVDRPRKVLLSGLLYTIGRSVAYVVVGIIIVASVMSIPDIAMFLQRHMTKLLGPMLLLAGLVLLDVFPSIVPGGGVSHRLAARVERWGVWGAGVLGMLFALSFCPVSAALFFGSLIPLAVHHQSTFVMPTVFGIGTALPVVAFAVIIAMGMRQLGKAYDKLAVFEKWARRLTAVAFIGIGCYLTLVYVLGMQL